MMSAVVLLLLGWPLAGGIVTLVWQRCPVRRELCLATGVAHAALTASCWLQRPVLTPGSWIGLDDLGLVFLSITSLIFLAAVSYAQGYLRQEQDSSHADLVEALLFTNEPESIFLACLQFFLAAMTFVTLSHHFGLLWVGIEATTLASAPLIYFHRHHRSLEATWKYLLICSVGIALALVGNFLLAVAAKPAAAEGVSLTLDGLLAIADRLDTHWLQAAFVFFLVGYGTKMGLAPMHTWLPDAHSEAPSLVSALLSGALLNCACLGVLRAHTVLLSAGVGGFSSQLLVFFGLLSMGVAGVFVLRQPDFKRMLAYSSIEHMGIVSLGAGLGSAGFGAAVYHACNHSLTKAALFLVAGNVLHQYRTKQSSRITGLFLTFPGSGFLWLAGFLSITGAPPFGTFLSEVAILRAALSQEAFLVSALYVGLLTLIFIGMGSVVLPMVQGPPDDATRSHREPSWSLWPSGVLLLCVIVLGVAMPSELRSVIDRASRVAAVAPETSSPQRTSARARSEPVTEPMAAAGVP
jgi:hydrogenase-4 component F